MQKSDVAVSDKDFRVVAEGRKRELAQKPPAAVSAPNTNDSFDFGVQDRFREVFKPFQVSSGKVALPFQNILAGRYLVSGCAKQLHSLFVLIGVEGTCRRHERDQTSLAKASESVHCLLFRS
jgi:hypothetical protein